MASEAIPLCTSTTATTRLYHALVLDAGPILSSAAAPSYYLTTADLIFTTPAVLAEIRDESARSRFETLWKPFVKVRSPKAESLRIVADFAKRTGDFAVLSTTDLGLAALAHELEVEVAGGDWRLRRKPGQRELNGPLPKGGSGTWTWEGLRIEKKEAEGEKERGKDGEGIEKTVETGMKTKKRRPHNRKKAMERNGDLRAEEVAKTVEGVAEEKPVEITVEKVEDPVQETKAEDKLQTEKKVEKEAKADADIAQKLEDVKPNTLEEKELPTEETKPEGKIETPAKEPEVEKVAEEKATETADKTEPPMQETKSEERLQAEEKVVKEVQAGTDIAQKLEGDKLDASEEKVEIPPQSPEAKKVVFEETAPEVYQPEEVVDESEEDDEDGWITPSNIHKHKNAKQQFCVPKNDGKYKLTVALATVDFALQNVMLQLNLHLVSPQNLVRITQVRTTVLRCHGCFYVLRHPSTKQTTDFCPRCGGLKTLLRTTCSTDAKGVFRVHLKRNFQYNNRGNVFSLPKQVHGTSSMKGVRENPVLREDQKEYTRAIKWEGWRKEKDMFDPDHLPNILTGERRRGNAIRTGMGRRNPNEPKRGGGKRK